MRALIGIAGIGVVGYFILKLMGERQRIAIYKVSYKYGDLWAASTEEAAAFQNILKSKGYQAVTIENAMGYMSWVEKSRKDIGTAS